MTDTRPDNRPRLRPLYAIPASILVLTMGFLDGLGTSFPEYAVGVGIAAGLLVFPAIAFTLGFCGLVRPGLLLAGLRERKPVSGKTEAIFGGLAFAGLVAIYAMAQLLAGGHLTMHFEWGLIMGYTGVLTVICYLAMRGHLRFRRRSSEAQVQETTDS